MEYAVVVCSKCRRAKAVVAGIKTSTCIYCGSTVKVDKLKVMYSSSSSSEVAKAAGLLNAKLAGGEDVYLEDLAESKKKERTDEHERESDMTLENYEEIDHDTFLKSYRDLDLETTPEGACGRDQETIFKSTDARLKGHEAMDAQENLEARSGDVGPLQDHDERDLPPHHVQFRIAAIAKTLTEKLGSFTVDDFIEVAQRVGIPKERAEKGLDAMRKTGLVYEPTHGRFAKVEND